MNATQLVVLDDTHEKIQYEGPWSFNLGELDSNPPTRDGKPFNHTLHQASGNESSFSVRFTGTNLRVVGSLTFDSSHSQPPIIRCSVDGIPYGTAAEAASTMWSSNQVVLCSVDDLSAGDHQVKFNVSSSSAPGYGTAYLDYVSYAPTGSVDDSEMELKVFANSSSSITFSPWWTLSDFADQHEGVYTQGNGASLTFKFSGTSATLFGFQPPNFPNAGSGTYSIDGANTTTFGLNGTALTATRLNEILFTTPDLEDKDHTLVVTNFPQPDKPSGTATTGFAPLAISHFIVRTTNGNMVGLPSKHSDGEKDFHMSLPVLIAIVVGSIGFTIVAVIFGVMAVRRRRERKHKQKMHSTVVDLNESAALITPYSLTSYDPTSPTSSSATATGDPRTRYEDLSFIPMRDEKRRPSETAFSSSSNGLASTSHAAPGGGGNAWEKRRRSEALSDSLVGTSTSGSSSLGHFVQSPMSFHDVEAQGIMQHMDSGYRLTNRNEAAEVRRTDGLLELPPGYTMT